MSGDSRKDFLVTTIGNHFGYSTGDGAVSHIYDSKELNSFLDDGNCGVLGARVELTHDVKIVQVYSGSLPEMELQGERWLVVFRLRPVPITPDNLHSNILVSTMVETPLESLYHAVQKVYAPILLKDSKWSKNLDSKMQQLLTDLEAGLKSVLRRLHSSHHTGGGGLDSSRSFEGSTLDDRWVSGVLSVSDEYDFWGDVSLSGSRLQTRERAQRFREILDPLVQEFAHLHSLSHSEVLELIETTQDALDELWKATEVSPPYPEERMAHLLEVVCDTLAHCVQRRLSSLDLWHGPFTLVHRGLHEGLLVCEKSAQVGEVLSGQFWKQFAPHPWKGDRFVSKSLTQFTARLDQLLTIRTVHEQLTRLLPAADQEALNLSASFTPFTGLQPLLHNPYTEPLWAAAVAQYERGMSPAESRIASVLCSRLEKLEAQPNQLLREFQKFKELIRRPTIGKELVSQRETLLGQLAVYIKSMREDFTQKSTSQQEIPQGKNVPQVVGNIVWTRQLEAKVSDTASTAQLLLVDLSSFKSFQQIAVEFLDELRDYQQDLFDSWSRDTQAAIGDKKRPLGLQSNAQLMELGHKDGKLQVFYSDRLVTLLREVRQLTALGFVVPAKIQHTAGMANKFYRQAVILKQVAHFYNTIDQQMIPSQQPMLLEAALQFEHIIKHPKADADSKDSDVHLTWENPDEVDKYISCLQQAADRLTSMNRRLRHCHANLLDLVVGLMGVDLLRQQAKWKDTLGKMRAVISGLVQEGYSPSNMRSWCLHWDHQLYKALEHQYQMGLESLNECLPEIKVELVYRQQHLQFRPPLEEIRSKFYREMRRFITIPLHFRGMGQGEGQLGKPQQTIFPRMIDRNAKGLLTVYRKAEFLFHRLKRVYDRFKDWVVLGQVDLDSLVEQNCFEVGDWENCFKDVKARGREAEKLPNVIRVDCITVSTLPIKASVEDHIQQLFDALLTSLRRSIQTNLSAIDQFLVKGKEALSVRPQTIEEIGDVNQAHKQLAKEKPSIEPLFAAAERKNRLLRSIAGSGVDQLGEHRTRWDKLEIMMESHQLMIKEQVEVMRSNVGSRVNAMHDQVERFAERWSQLKPKDDVMEADSSVCAAALATVKDRKVELQQLMAEWEKLRGDCTHFGLPDPELPLLGQLQEEIDAYDRTWALYDQFYSGLGELAQQDWLSFRAHTYKFDDFLSQWVDKIRSTSESSAVMVRLQREVERMEAALPLLKYVGGEILSMDHWQELFHLLELPRDTTMERLTFGEVLGASDLIVQKAQDLKELHSRAQGELSIREALKELELWGSKAAFNLSSFEDSQQHTVQIIRGWSDIIQEVGDNRCLLQSLKDSPYFAAFSDRVQLWEGRLTELDEHLLGLNQIQRRWVYLEPIFGGGALPQEQGRFKRIDKEFRTILSEVEHDSRVLSLVKKTGLKKTVSNLLEQLKICQKALNEFLEEKRAAFPRFYFIGDEDLLEILGQSTNPQVIQAHLKKLFAGISKVEFSEGDTSITAMKSQEGEMVCLSNPVAVTTNVEVWLANLTSEMRHTLHLLLKAALATARGKDQSIDPTKFPSQVLCLSEQILFTQRCEEAISGGSLQELLIELESQLAGYTHTDLKALELGKEELHVLDLKLKALIMDCIHFIDVVQQLMAAGTRSTKEWQWQKQLRFYLEGHECTVCMVDATFKYTYEYQGNAPKLVYTPLTDKCYLTLTQGMLLGLGGNPYGPAGTGKTESVKALGNLFGRQVLVFNCDEGLDIKSMGRIFIGLVKCGAWGCFDEFNRLEEAVLSAVSMQIQTIQDSIQNRVPTTELLGREVDLDPNAGIFITLNPAGKGYGGRQKLPDNLKQLFRPVAMSRPDNELIAEVLLFAEGFKQAKLLGKKLVAAFSLSRELLSTQQHYDWGLRALKTVLQAAGTLLRSERKKGNAAVGADQEASLVVQALRLNTLSKLTFADSKRFNSLVADIFVGVAFEDVAQPDLEQALHEACQEAHLVVNPTQIRKAIELCEQLRQRMGVVIVGPSGSGKTTLWQLLKAALQKMGNSIKSYTMNPKAMPRTQLLGHIDLDTREWTDGVLTFSARQVVKEPPEVTSWITCDGDIDPEWIESLNSVLDDNHLLTMPNGERIQFGSNVNFVFETHDLSCASPATISRMGMLFLSAEDVDVKALVKFWLQSHTPSTDPPPYFESWISDYFYPTLEWVLSAGNQVVDTTVTGLVVNGLTHVHQAQSKTEFVCGLIRGFGGNLAEMKKAELAKVVLGMAHEVAPDPRRPLDTFYDERTGDLATYRFEVPDSIDLSHLPLVLTPSVQRTLDTVQPWLASRHRQPFLLVGPEGCGKELLLRHCFMSLPSTQVATVQCSAQTTPAHILQKLTQMCLTLSTNVGRVLRPKDCERVVLFLKDLNLPKPDKWGTSQLSSFIQQLITYNGFYDSNLEFVGMEGIQIVGSMTSSSSLGRHALTTRLTSVVCICSMSYPDRDQLETIYSTYLTAVCRAALGGHPVWSNTGKVHALAASMVRLYYEVQRRFTADQHTHYIFTPRDLTKWTQSFLRYGLQESTEETSLLEVFAYEARRLLRDRLVGSKHQEMFDALLATILREEWSFDSGSLVKGDGVYFTTFGVSGGVPYITSSQGHPLGRLSRSDLSDILSKTMKQYSRDQSEVNYVLLPEVLDFAARLDRILTQPGGSLLVVGRSGAGRRTLLQLVAYSHNIAVVTPKITRNYAVKNFKADLKVVLQQAGVNGEEVVLLLEDHQIVDSKFLELINSLLSSGEIPGIFTPEELDPLLAPLKDMAAEESHSGSLFFYFTQRVRTHLHVAILMDSLSPGMVEACEANPAFYTQCSFQVVEGWGLSSMTQLPAVIMDQSHGGVTRRDGPSGSEMMGVTPSLCQSFVFIHQSCSAVAAPPRKFITLIRTYQKVFQEKKTLVSKRQKHLHAGVQKLDEATALVANLKTKAAHQGAILAEKQAEADQALAQITKAMEEAGEQKSEMEVLKEQQVEEKAKLEKRKKAIDIELSEIEPLVTEAKKAVGSIKSETLSEIRALRAPPDVIREILEGVLCIMGTSDTSWSSMRSFLAKRGIKEEIINFDARRISPETRLAVNALLDKNKKSFDPAAAKRASQAALPLATWVKASVKYSEVLEKIQPLEKEQEHLQRNLDRSEARMSKLQSALDKVDRHVAELRTTFEQRTTEAAKLKLDLEKAQEMLLVAENLVGKLEGEHHRWTEQMSSLTSELDQLPQRALLTAGFITYLGHTPEDVRRQLLSSWVDHLNLELFDFKRFLASESEQLQWKVAGLPADQLSMENACVLLQSIQCPFLIDPSQQATQWLQKLLSNQRLEVVAQQDTNFTTSLELAIRFGKTLLVQEVDSLEPILYPLLRGDLIKQGPRFVVPFGDKLVDFNEHFKLFLSTRNPIPNLPPDATAIVNEVNFTITRAGLTAQLLDETLLNEKPELQAQMTSLLKKEEELKVQLTGLEESLLSELATAEGNILENKSLLDSLNETKAKSITITEALKESVKLQESLDQEREVYLPVAQSGSVLFFLISDLCKLNNMYQFGLPSFLKLFRQALTFEEDMGHPDLRMRTLSQSLLKLIYEHVCTSLFKSDHLTFALYLTHGVHPNLFKEHEWELFLGMAVGETMKRHESTKQIKDSLPQWCDPQQAQAVANLKNTLPTVFEALDLHSNDIWSKFARSTNCERDFPSSVQKRITTFQQVLVIQAVRPDRLQSALENFAIKSLSLKELTPSSVNLKQLHKMETQASEPVLFIVSPGADPSTELEELAREVVGKDHYHQVAMGQGQSDIALRLLRDCASNGDWLCLKNLHLMIHWLSVLEKELNSLTPHSNFRLWLTTESHPNFPSVLLQSSLKVTFEAPPGIKRNLQRTYNSWTPSYLSEGNSIKRTQALFALAWFHAVVQERRKFIPAGWTQFYEFSAADLRTGASIIDRMMGRVNSGESIWTFMLGLMENAVYGGRVDNEYDMMVLQSFLKQFFNTRVINGKSSPMHNPGEAKKLGLLAEMPSSTRMQDYVSHISSLPESDSPDLLGLPSNIERSAQRMTSGLVIDQLKTLLRPGQADTHFDHEHWMQELGPLLSLWKKLNQGADLISLKVVSPSSHSKVSPVDEFILFERYNAVHLVQTIHCQLAALNKVLKASTLMSSAVHSLATFLLCNKVPAQWCNLWEGPADPFEYLRALVAKTMALGLWFEKQAKGELLKDGLDLSDLFRPSAFISAVQQQTARQLGVSIDDLKLESSFEGSRSIKGACLPVQITGLLLEGAGFDGKCLVPCRGDSPISVPLSTLTLAWVPKSSPPPYSKDMALIVPLYMSHTREKVVVSLSIPTADSTLLQSAPMLTLKL